MSATTILVSNPQELKAALSKAQPGDSILLKAGIWKDVPLIIETSGTKEKPSFIVAQEPGKVQFTGNSFIRFGSDYVTVSGIHFTNGYTTDRAVVEFRNREQQLANSAAGARRVDPPASGYPPGLGRARQEARNCGAVLRTVRTPTSGIVSRSVLRAGCRSQLSRLRRSSTQCPAQGGCTWTDLRRTTTAKDGGMERSVSVNGIELNLIQEETAKTCSSSRPGWQRPRLTGMPSSEGFFNPSSPWRTRVVMLFKPGRTLFRGDAGGPRRLVELGSTATLVVAPCPASPPWSWRPSPPRLCVPWCWWWHRASRPAEVPGRAIGAGGGMPVLAGSRGWGSAGNHLTRPSPHWWASAGYHPEQRSDRLRGVHPLVQGA